MADVGIVLVRDTKSNIDAMSVTDGYVYFQTDQGDNNKILMDYGTSRVQVGGTRDTDTSFSATSTNPIANETVYNGLKTVSCTLTASGWSSATPYSQTALISGVKSSQNFKEPFLVPTGNQSVDQAQNTALTYLSYASVADGSITFYCYDTKPTVDLPLYLTPYLT
jgi:hypothetical protein